MYGVVIKNIQEKKKEQKKSKFYHYWKTFGQKSTDDFIKFHEIGIQSKHPNDFIEYEMIESLTDRQVIEYLMEIWKLKNINDLMDFSTSKKIEYIAKLKETKGISMLQLSRITGINRKIIKKALK